MRRDGAAPIRRAQALWRALLAGWLLWLCPPAGAAALHLTQAEVWASPSTDWQAPASLHALPAPDDALLDADTAWQTVALPHAEPRSLWATLGEWAPQAPQVLWYRLRLPAGAQRSATEAAPAQPRLYLPRWQTVGTLAIYVNGALAWQSGQRPWSGFNHPVWVDLADLALDDRPVWIHLRMARQPGVGGALSTLWVGPASELLPRWRWRSFLQTDLLASWRGSFLMLGLFALGLALWLRRAPPAGRQRGDARPFLLFFAMALGQSLAALLYLVGSDGLDIDFTWFAWLTLVALISVPVCALPFLCQVQRQPRPRLVRAVTAYAGVAALASLPLWWPNHAAALPLLRLLLLPPVIVLVGVAVADARRLRSRPSVLLAAWGLLSLPMGAHDMLMQGYRLDIEGLFLSPYVNLGLLTLFLYIAFRRYTDALATADRAHATLASRLAAQARELEQTHEQLRAAEREQTLLNERQRLMREMHDGVGSSLISALRMVERGQATADVTRVLKECIDDLKIAIDSLECTDADLLALLGALRFRLGRRLAGAGIALHWRMSDVPALPWLDAQSALHVLRILQEVLANIVRHSGATRITVTVAEAPPSPADGAPGVHVHVHDDGRPFQPPAPGTPQALAPGRRGLANLRARVQVLGARCHWHAGDGTRFTLWLPLQRVL